MLIRDEIDAEIYELGSVLIDSDLMERAKTQVHHEKTTLYAHIIDVTRSSVDMCNRLGNSIEIDRKSVILAALCHDIGMVGRYEKYSGKFASYRQHPMESVRIAREYFPDMDVETQKIIRKHMWPISLVPPTTIEEWIVLVADKTVAWKDVAISSQRVPMSH